MTHRYRLWRGLLVINFCLLVPSAFAQTANVAGTVRDETGGALPGASIELRPGEGTPLVAVTDGQGVFRFDRSIQRDG